MKATQGAERACSACGCVRPATDYVSRSSRCRDCRAEYRKDHYRRNKDYYKTKARQRQKIVIEANKAYILAYLLKHPCIDCGESDPRVLEFDHRDGTVKVAAVSSLARGGYSLEAVRREIESCDVRCANCHRRRTHDQRGWWGRARHDSNVQPFDP